VALERGFRRVVIVLTCFLLAVGIAIDAFLIIPHTTVRITLNDGRQETIEVKWVGDYPTDRTSLAQELSERHGASIGASDIQDVKVLRGLKYVWWSDYVGTSTTAGLIGVLWLSFYAVRWIARGFARQ
jgi:hypothetical protein